MKDFKTQSNQKSSRNCDSRTDFLAEASFYCSVEWHLYRMKSEFAPVLYSWARKITYKTGVLSASAERIAQYFSVERKTVLRALDELSLAGFLELTQIERFKPNVYKIVGHTEWAKRHPRRCVKKISFPWDGEGDLLGQQLFAISGQRVKFLPNQVAGLRALGFSGEKIIEAWRLFLDDNGYEGKQWRQRAYYDFYDCLKERSTTHSDIPAASVAAA
jgi:hypothetical protein